MVAALEQAYIGIAAVVARFGQRGRRACLVAAEVLFPPLLCRAPLGNMAASAAAC